MNNECILLEHGAGGLLSNQLINGLFLPILRNPHLEPLADGAVFPIGEVRCAFSTDSYVVKPLFFPGGDIGSLAVHGTVNDLAMCGGRPLCLSAGFIIEEGFPQKDLERITRSMAEAAGRAGVQVVTGDTKVVNRGAADGLYITTAGLGIIDYPNPIAVTSIEPGDVVIVNGPIGCHGAAILSVRAELQVGLEIRSDSAPLNALVRRILAATPRIHCMRDATRGGLGAILTEIAVQSGCEIAIDEHCVPVDDCVRGLCEVLGFDPLFLANEGRAAIFCPAEDAERVLAAMQGDEEGKGAVIIGKVNRRGRGRLIINTCIGGTREVDLPTGELVPRIC